ncbi:MAG TPA: SHOCT domain-containing protein [Allosphingosinicella sp.]|nr:SHOCT domain-containing protein [Allosphingosinicella sp.]
MTGRIEALERLQRLRESGALSDEEFAAEKAALLGRAGTVAAEAPAPDLGREPVVAPGRRGSEWKLPAAVLAALAMAALAVWLILRGGGESINVPQLDAAASAPEPAERNGTEAAPAPTIRGRSDAEQLAAAFRSAFGNRATREVEEQQITFVAGRLIWIGNRAVLVSDGTNAEESHASPGMVAVHYLEPQGEGFRVTGEWLDVDTDDYGRPPAWRIASDLTGRPALRVEGGGGNQGIFCHFIAYYDLAVDRPTQIARVQTGYSNAGAVPEESGEQPVDLEGRIGAIVRSRSFDVAYSGSERFTEHYVMRGGRYVLAAAESRVPTC